jgi:hypothetical protein
MLVDNFGDKIVHRSRTGVTQAVGKLVQRETSGQLTDVIRLSD